MCEFCHKHGEGKKWYLQAQNYSEDLLSDLRRTDFIEDFMSKPKRLARSVDKIGRMDNAPKFVKRSISKVVTKRMKKDHFGQVLPIEEIERIFEFVTSVFRISCVCRMGTIGSEHRYCYGLSMAPREGKLLDIIRKIDKGYLEGPYRFDLETVSKKEALNAMAALEKEGLCHTVWGFILPFIGGICNCDQTDCLAMKMTTGKGVPVFFRAEYIADIDPDTCNGCRQCLRVCQFGAIIYSAAQKKAKIRIRDCYGCGICRSVCRENAISLKERDGVEGYLGIDSL